ALVPSLARPGTPAGAGRRGRGHVHRLPSRAAPDEEAAPGRGVRRTSFADVEAHDRGRGAVRRRLGPLRRVSRPGDRGPGRGQLAGRDRVRGFGGRRVRAGSPRGRLEVKLIAAAAMLDSSIVNLAIRIAGAPAYDCGFPQGAEPNVKVTGGGTIRVLPNPRRKSAVPYILRIRAHDGKDLTGPRGLACPESKAKGKP